MLYSDADKGKAGDPSKDAEDKCSSAIISTELEEDKVAPEDVDRGSKKTSVEKWPDRVTAFASLLLVGVGFWGTSLVVEQMGQTEEALGVAQESLAAAREATRLEQRPWLGYNEFAIIRRASPDAKWESGEPGVGEQFGAKFSVNNTGKTPALDGEFMSIHAEMVSVGEVPAEPDRWVSLTEKFAFFPNADRLSHTTYFGFVRESHFSEFSEGRKELFFWARLCYSDIWGERHLTQFGVAYAFGEGFKMRRGIIRTVPRESSCAEVQAEQDRAGSLGQEAR